MERVLELRLPWGMIRKHVAMEMKDGKVDYESCLDRYHIEAMFSKVNVKTSKKNKTSAGREYWYQNTLRRSGVFYMFIGGNIQV